MHDPRSMIACLVALLGPIPAGDAAAQELEYDTSGLTIFWETADVLAADRAPSEPQWNRLLEHPGYEQIERQGNRARAVRRCMSLVFRPSKRSALAAALEGDDSRVRRVCAHLDEARIRRNELRRFERAVAGRDELEQAIELAADYLPDGATRGPKPPVYLILFEPNGFGGASLALDAMLLHDMSREQRLGYLAHEFFHAFRDRVDRIEIDGDDPERSLVGALANLAEEGIPSLLDKRRWLEPGFADSLKEPWPEIVTTFQELYGGSAEVLSEVDRQLSAVARGERSAAEVGPEIGRGLPWGGHPTGMYMALAIERAEGSSRLAELAANPLAFVLAYRRVSESNADLYRFSDDAARYVRRLYRRYTPK